MLKRSVLLMLILASVILYPSLSEEIIEIPVLVDIPVDWLDDQPDAVLRAQKSLVALGYLAGGADGVYGPKTEAALRAFQEANALPVTGHLEAKTLDHLGQLASNTASTADIQQRLIDLGYLQGGADGIWGPRSETAMSAFQQMNGLPETGETVYRLRDPIRQQQHRVEQGKCKVSERTRTQCNQICEGGIM